MPDAYVLHASAVLALFKREAGADLVRQHIENSVMSTINYAEVASILVKEMTIEEADALITGIDVKIVPFDYEQARYASEIAPKTAPFGLSLGDWFCLSLAKKQHLPVLTADKIWKNVDVGVQIKLIR